ncbi:unnamed protein product [Rhodiola kirilowii]
MGSGVVLMDMKGVGRFHAQSPATGVSEFVFWICNMPKIEICSMARLCYSGLLRVAEFVGTTTTCSNKKICIPHYFRQFLVLMEDDGLKHV